MKKGIMLLISAALVIIDQLLKKWVVASVKPHATMTAIPGVLSLTYVENRGAAFGILYGMTGLLTAVTGIVLLAVLVMLFAGKLKGPRLAAGSLLILSGGIGNFIDRLLLGYVVDYLDVSPLFSFPVFNFADCCVVIGTGLILWFIIAGELTAGKEQAHTSLPDDQKRDEQA